MKFIEKQIEDTRTGAIAEYHVVTGFNVDYVNGSTSVLIGSYVSKDKKEAGKEALSINSFTIQSVPDWSLVPYEWALKELVKEPPADFVPEDYTGYVNPYMFAGGKVKDAK